MSLRLLSSLLLLPAALAAQIQVTIPSAQDNTLYEDPTGALSNGAGSRFFIGVNGFDQVRRGVIAFDVAGAIPSCATIVSADLVLQVVMSISGPVSCGLHRCLERWGEGASVATVMGQGQGGASAAGDATWIHTFYPSQSWTSAGGAYAAAASGTLPVDQLGPHTWASTPAMVADVQAWLDAPAANYGWLLRTDETVSFTAKAFATKEDQDPTLRPALRVTYSVPEARAVSTGTGCAGSGASELVLAPAADGRPQLPSPGFQLILRGGPAGPSVFLLAGALLRAPIPVGGCFVYLDLTGPTLALPGSPTRTLALPLPASPALYCQQLSAQGVVVDGMAGGLATSNALTLEFGQ